MSETDSDTPAVIEDESETKNSRNVSPRELGKAVRRTVLASAIFATCTAGALIAWTLNGSGAAKTHEKAGLASSASAVSSKPGTANPSLPFTYALTYMPDASQCEGWVFPGKQPSDMPSPPVGGLTSEWAHSHGGIDDVTTRLKIVLQGATQADVELSNLRVVDVRKQKPVAGTDVKLSTQCGGVIEDRVFQVALGTLTPQIRLVTDKGDGTPSVGDVPVSFKTADNDPEVWIIEASDSLAIGKPNTSCGCTATWRLAVDWSYKGESKTLIIDDHGRPFQTGGSGTATLLELNGSWSRFS
ncbi:hypothetical protein [Streptacidiphilus cavernicola]|uniref:Secreted protein n=1 Tax=Streptacidiphilus cavernicola TaxID=3342716 RepID=A0ABV6W6P5_9ACTN